MAAFEGRRDFFFWAKWGSFTYKNPSRLRLCKTLRSASLLSSSLLPAAAAAGTSASRLVPLGFRMLVPRRIWMIHWPPSLDSGSNRSLRGGGGGMVGSYVHACCWWILLVPPLGRGGICLLLIDSTRSTARWRWGFVLCIWLAIL